jgi:hypothetical protein
MALPIIQRGPVPPGEKPGFLKHVCPPQLGPANPDPLPPTRTFARNLLVGLTLNLPFTLPNGQSSLDLWIIEDPNAQDPNRRTFPSPLLRTVQGDIVHVDVGFQGNSHTIHWHGIDPSPMNDGVGKHSFESTSHFLYQFATNEPGTYFYHCHKNTTLHFTRGLYGAHVVDPPKPAGAAGPNPPYPAGGPGFVAALNPPTHVIPYDVEAFWVPGEFDPLWHQLDHNAFMQSCNPNDPVAPGTFDQQGFLNDFRPQVFHITGVVSAGAPIVDPRAAIHARVGQTILVRLIHAGYTVQQYTLGLDATVIGIEGRALGVPPAQRYSFPFTIRAGVPFRLTSARRHDLIFKPKTAGTFISKVDFIDWVSGVKYHTAQIPITVV